MTSKRNALKIRDASGWTIFVFGVLALLLGFEIIPRAQRPATDYTLVFIMASSMASFNMGVYYILAALNDLKIFYRWTVPFRSITFVVFPTLVLMQLAPSRFLGVELWELTGANRHRAGTLL
jgi:amino acid transporter